MYKFVVLKGSCGQSYDTGSAENTANQMFKNGFELVDVYQTSTTGCSGGQTVLVMIFKKQN